MYHYLLIFGSYTNKTTVEGQLLPTMGVVRVYSSDIGTITHKFVEDGNFVKAGEPLFKLSTSRFGEKGNVQAKLAAEANLKNFGITRIGTFKAHSSK